MKKVVVRLSISADEFIRHYQGQAKQVLCYDELGRKIQFPSRVLQPFVLHDGVQGRFAIYFDDDNRFQRAERLNP